MGKLAAKQKRLQKTSDLTKSVLTTPVRKMESGHGFPFTVPACGGDFSRVPLHAKTPVTVQPKLAISTPGDVYEREADRLADQVMRAPEPLPRTSAGDGERQNSHTRQEPHEHLQTKSLQANHSVETAVPPIVHEVLNTSGEPLDAATRAFMEPRFGHDFSRVRVHTDERSAAAASAINARAFTSNRDIVFGASQYAPHTASGRQLLSHELAHVVQQPSINALYRAAKIDAVKKPTLSPTTQQLTHDELNHDDIKKNYFEIVDKGPAHYMEAIQYLIDTYSLDASYASMRYDPAMTGAYAITEGDVGDAVIPLRFGPLCFDKSVDFGVISRAVAHELLHTKQKAASKMSDHNEREFLAYYDTITRTDLPEINDKATLRYFVTKALDYYKKLSATKQSEYAEKKKVVDEVKQKLLREMFAEPKPK